MYSIHIRRQTPSSTKNTRCLSFKSEQKLYVINLRGIQQQPLWYFRHMFWCLKYLVKKVSADYIFFTQKLDLKLVGTKYVYENLFIETVAKNLEFNYTWFGLDWIGLDCIGLKLKKNSVKGCAINDKSYKMTKTISITKIHCNKTTKS